MTGVPMRLLAIIEASTITGPARNLLLFAQYARRPSNCPPVDVHIAVFRRPGKPTLFADTARRLPVPVTIIPEEGRFDLSVIRRLADLTREIQPDLIQSHGVKSHCLTRMAGLDKTAPWIPFHHGYTWENLRVRAYNQLDRWSLRTAARVLTVCGPFRRELIAKGVAPERIEVIHNALDLDAEARIPVEPADALKERLGVAPESRIILSVGRLSREKDHLTLLKAFRRLRCETPVTLVIVGDGSQRPALEAEILTAGLAGRVILTGQVPSAAPFYRIADVAALSSRSEGSPYALLEAMAARLPVVATSVGGVPEIVTDGESALLVEPGDDRAMAQALDRALADPALARRLGESAHCAVLERHGPEAWTGRLIGIYAGVLSGRSKEQP
jgi:glycosyltransferase involved in cell wall biosynthesis